MTRSHSEADCYQIVSCRVSYPILPGFHALIDITLFVKDSGTVEKLGIVKLHSDLRILTQLELVGVGIDFVFPLEEGRKEEVTPT